MGKFHHVIKTSLLSVPLRFKILGLALGLILLFGTVTVFRIQQEVNKNINFILQEESRFIASELSYQSRDFLLINDLFGLTNILKNTTLNRPNLRYAFVVDHRNNILAHTFGSGFPISLLEVHVPFKIGDEPSVSRLSTNEGAVWDTWMPIFPDGDKIIRIGVKEENMRNRLSLLINALIRNTVFIAITGIFLALMLTWLIARPVNQLLQATRKVRKGDYSVSLVAESRDEVGRLIDGFNEMVEELRIADKARAEKELLQRDFLQRLIAAQENERKRIARELHDQTGQALASFKVELKVLEKKKSEQDITKAIQRLKQSITKEMDSIHNLVFELRPSVLDDLGLIPAINMYVKDFRERHKIDTQLTTLGFTDRRAESCAETCVYRIIQEALTNSVKHAQSTEVTILLEWRNDIIRGVIEDNGVGFEMENVDTTGQMGLYGMQERAQLLNGSCSIDSEPGAGTMVQFKVPVTAEVCYV